MTRQSYGNGWKGWKIRGSKRHDLQNSPQKFHHRGGAFYSNLQEMNVQPAASPSSKYCEVSTKATLFSCFWPEVSREPLQNLRRQFNTERSEENVPRVRLNSRKNRNTAVHNFCGLINDNFWKWVSVSEIMNTEDCVVEYFLIIK